MSFFAGLSSGSKTFKPTKKLFEGSKQYQLMQYADVVLGSGDLQQTVALPEGEDADEWIAVHLVDFFNHINMLYGTVTEFCTKDHCPIMTAGPKYEYQWSDDKIKKPIKVSAPEYMEFLMKWVQSQLDDESLFPSKMGVPFPKTFRSNVSNIFKRLFRVYAHIYHHHFPHIVALGQEPHLNTSLKHFVLFSNEFGLVEKREYAPLDDLIKALIE